MKNTEFVEKLKQLQQCDTLYVSGAYGQPLNKTNQEKLITQYSSNKKRAKVIRSKDENTFAGDCSGIVKGILWGWCGDKTKPNGGAKYASNNVPDINAAQLLSKCKDVSTDFSKVEIGEFLWMAGHCGVYIGDGLCIESTPKWLNGVLISGVKNMKTSYEGRTRSWTKHGKLPWITYENVNTEKPTVVETIKYYVVKKGDTLGKIALKHRLTLAKILNLNPNITDPNVIYVGQKVRVK